MLTGARGPWPTQGSSRKASSARRRSLCVSYGDYLYPKAENVHNVLYIAEYVPSCMLYVRRKTNTRWRK